MQGIQINSLKQIAHGLDIQGQQENLHAEFKMDNPASATFVSGCF